MNLSALVIVLVCFFLPWIQVSCAGAKDTLSGLDLARHEDGLLWLIPVLMLVLILSALRQLRQEQNGFFSLASTLCGLVCVYLMNRERVRAYDESDVITAELTGWFWLGFFSAGAVAISGILLLRNKWPRVLKE
ncbi:MAG: hypothetical protein C5B55_11285 [Blastocatellia bacterium]|nr:MAG: hypothetical protein C5B55_11285 [Blastocatellia bacterium]